MFCNRNQKLIDILTFWLLYKFNWGGFEFLGAINLSSFRNSPSFIIRGYPLKKPMACLNPPGIFSSIEGVYNGKP